MEQMKFIVVVFVALCGIYSSVEAQDKVSVAVYYESLCPDSIKFITKQLYPTLQHENLNKYIDLKLVPYGKSSQEFSSEGWRFICHHGPNECYGNKVQACALSLSKDNSNIVSKEVVGYINCLMSKVDKDSNPFTYPTKECASANNIQNVVQIESCANGTEGSTALQQLGVTTQSLRPELKSVPTIIFDNLFNQEDQTLAVDNFQKALCLKLKNRDQIPECQGSGAGFSTPLKIVTIASAVLVSVMHLY